MTNLVGPVSMGIVFGLLAKYGHAVVAGFGVAVRIESLALMILMALSSSISPMVGQNWGAGNHDRIDAALRFGFRFSFAWGVFIFAVLAVFGRGIVGLINSDPAVIEATYHYLLIVPLTYSTMGVSMVSGQLFRRTGQAPAIAAVVDHADGLDLRAARDGRRSVVRLSRDFRRRRGRQRTGRRCKLCMGDAYAAWRARGIAGDRPRANQRRDIADCDG